MRGSENLCPSSAYTGWDADGAHAEYLTVHGIGAPAPYRGAINYTGGMDDNGKPVDIYARVSEVDRNQKKRGLSREPSTEGQVAVCRARLTDLGHAVGEVLVDPNRSAWNPAVKRPAWDDLMDRVERRVSGGFIVFDLERYTRQPKDAERMIDLATHGFLVLDSESEYDLTSPNGKKSFRDAINAAAYYSDRLSTRSGAASGSRPWLAKRTPPTRPFGFEADLVTLREDEATSCVTSQRAFWWRER